MALINRYFTTLGAYSDSRRFFQYEISSLFFQPLTKKLKVGAEDIQMLFQIRVYILKTFTDLSFVQSLMIQYFMWAIW